VVALLADVDEVFSCVDGNAVDGFFTFSDLAVAEKKNVFFWKFFYKKIVLKIESLNPKIKIWVKKLSKTRNFGQLSKILSEFVIL